MNKINDHQFTQQIQNKNKQKKPKQMVELKILQEKCLKKERTLKQQWNATTYLSEWLNPCCVPHPSISNLGIGVALLDQLSWYHSPCVQVAHILLNNGTKAQT